MFKAISVLSFCLLFSMFSLLGGCAADAVRSEAPVSTAVSSPVAEIKTAPADDPTAAYSKRATIEITENGPADTVRTFYAYLREKKIREALFLTNLRPAIEGLTESELDDLKVDFEQIAVAVPAEVEINGEIISGNYATVTARLPDNETREVKLQEVRLRKESNYWIILTVEETAEAQIKKEGNRYFFNLRIETHEAEAKAMLERILKSQTVYALQNGGLFGDMSQLIGAGLLPEDANSTDSTGYQYRLMLGGDKKKYYATAVPASYGKTGRLSFLLEFDGKNPKFSSKDVQGQPLKK